MVLHVEIPTKETRDEQNEYYNIQWRFPNSQTASLIKLMTFFIFFFDTNTIENNLIDNSEVFSL